MLTGIGLRNFKAFGDEMQEAPLSKITLIYGPNSGGKSSIIQALLLLKQSLKPSYGRDRRLESKGEFADLGSPQAMLHKHDKERELGISLKYRNTEFGENYAENHVSMLYWLDGDNAENEVSLGINLLEVSYKIISEESDVPSLVASKMWLSQNIQSVKVMDVDVEQFLYQSNEEFLPTLYLPALKEARKRIGAEVDSEWVEEVETAWKKVKVQEQMRRNSTTRSARRARIPRLPELNDAEKARVREQRQAEWVEPKLELDELHLSSKQIRTLTPENIPIDYQDYLRLINYLGPLRSAPQRIYTRSSADDGTTGIEGEYSANVLAQDHDGVETEVNRWFRQFEIPYDIHARKWDEASHVGEFIIIELMPLGKDGYIRDEDFAVTLADVGYGINQILPVIIEGIASQEGAILCVEQPEIHLHPRLQANIADLMIDTIADEPGKRKQWIVETHSELLITRLQRRIREGKISPDDISVLYVDPDDDNGVEGSAILRLEMDENGDFIEHWPHGFFDEVFNELMAEPESQLHPAD